MQENVSIAIHDWYDHQEKKYSLTYRFEHSIPPSQMKMCHFIFIWHFEVTFQANRTQKRRENSIWMMGVFVWVAVVFIDILFIRMMFSGVTRNTGNVEPYDRDRMTLRFSFVFSSSKWSKNKKPRYIFSESNRGHIHTSTEVAQIEEYSILLISSETIKSRENHRNSNGKLHVSRYSFPHYLGAFL